MRVFFTCFLCFLCLPAFALDLQGNFVQGGFVHGKTIPDATITLDGKTIPSSEDGFFILGFGREYPETATLVITAPNGSTTTRKFNVKAQDYQIERIDNLPDSKVTPRTQAQIDQIMRESKLKKGAYRNVSFTPNGFKQNFIWPVKGRISGQYGSQRILNGIPKRPHFGLDIAAPTGTDIIAPADGIVTLSRNDMYFEGGTLFIDHGQGLTSVMIHLSDVIAKEGQHIKQGELIGKVGMTGRATGPHLHWGIKLRGQINLDPLLTLPPQ